MAEIVDNLQGHMAAEAGRNPVEFPTVKSLLVQVRRGEMVIGTATGTLLARSPQTPCVLVTNRHVVTGRHQDTGQALHKQGATPDNLLIHFHAESEDGWRWKAITLPLHHSNEDPIWIEHPRLGQAADIVAVNLAGLSDIALYPYYLDTAHDRIGMIVRPAEPVSVLGFPFGLASTENFPIWTTGLLAQELSLVTPEHPVFLIDSRTRAGQSGAPVIAFRTGMHRVQQGTKATTKVSAMSTAWELLGIYSGRINAESDLGRVWHVSILGELLDAADADYQGRLTTPP